MAVLLENEAVIRGTGSVRGLFKDAGIFFLKD